MPHRKSRVNAQQAYCAHCNPDGIPTRENISCRLRNEPAQIRAFRIASNPDALGGVGNASIDSKRLFRPSFPTGSRQNQMPCKFWGTNASPRVACMARTTKFARSSHGASSQGLAGRRSGKAQHSEAARKAGIRCRRIPGLRPPLDSRAFPGKSVRYQMSDQF